MPSHYDPQHNPSKQRKKKRIIIPIAIILIIAIGDTVFMFWPASISRYEAQEIAIAYVGGSNSHSNPTSRDFERFQRVWSVEVFYNGLIHEVYVSMRTGEVVVVEIDRWD